MNKQINGTEAQFRRKISAGATNLGIFHMCMTNDTKEVGIFHGKYREKIKEGLKQSPEEHQHLRDEQKKRGCTQKGTKRKNQR